MGTVTGLTVEDVESLYPESLALRRAGQMFEPPGAEPGDAFVRRALDGILSAVDDETLRPTLVVSHGGLLQAVATYLHQPKRPYRNLDGYWLSVDDDHVLRFVHSFSHSDLTFLPRSGTRPHG
jgi:broad specificity phosphatase PhoE